MRWFPPRAQPRLRHRTHTRSCSPPELTSCSGMRATRRVCGVSVSSRRTSEPPGDGAGGGAAAAAACGWPQAAASGTWMARLGRLILGGFFWGVGVVKK